jgi:hypothetical protein
MFKHIHKHKDSTYHANVLWINLAWLEATNQRSGYAQTPTQLTYNYSMEIVMITNIFGWVIWDINTSRIRAIVQVT